MVKSLEILWQGWQTKIWFPKPDCKKSTHLLTRNNLSRLVQFLTGHNKLKRHKNLQNGVNDPYSCRLCLEEEESSFHVIAECPATLAARSGVFKLPTPTTLPNPPDWTVRQVDRFLKKSQVGNILDQDWFNPDSNYSTIRYTGPLKGIQGGVLGRNLFLFFTHLFYPPNVRV